ncbi:MAG: hypothetical protein EA384_04505 [Spirochaetaceae bacterium]|nr:MAG: hypothetical protein EA384_04505 [Spirochaetaceae bacterium]
MSQDHVRQNEEQVQRLLDQSYNLLKQRQIDRAAELIERALSVDFDSAEVVTSLKYVNFWKDRQATADTIGEQFERAEYLTGQWRLFHSFVDRVGERSEKCLYAIRHHVFGQALDHYLKLYDESGGAESELLLRLGRCYKGMGEYDRALEYLEQAAAGRRDDPQTLAELADCYALVNEVQKSKAFFREAFFIGAGAIDLQVLESEMISRLVEKVRELGFESPALEEWIPVYGVLYGVFTVKRELRSIEYGKLKQSIYALEREYSDTRQSNSAAQARLFNRYFWLIDHYVNTHEDQSKIDEVLLKIRSVDSRIYHQYTN